jgi:hypothetical protein
VKPADRRLATLAAVMAPAMAERLLGRIAGGAPAAALAARLSAESRAVRLAALAEALGNDRHPDPRQRLLAAMSVERPGVAAALRALAPDDAREETGPGLVPAPLLARLCIERLESLLRSR